MAEEQFQLFGMVGKIQKGSRVQGSNKFLLRQRDQLSGHPHFESVVMSLVHRTIWCQGLLPALPYWRLLQLWHGTQWTQRTQIK